MHLVADAVSGAGKVNAVLFGDRLDKAVVVSVFKACLERIVVDICDAFFRLDPWNTHGLKLKICHGSGRVLREGLVDFQADIAADGHIAAEQVFFDYLLCKSVAQDNLLLLFQFVTGGKRRLTGSHVNNLTRYIIH